MRNSFPFIALIAWRNGGSDLKPFFSEAEFTTFCNLHTPQWATLTDDNTGVVILQVSYPE